MAPSTAIRNVILVGGTGNLGAAILDALLADAQFTVTVLSRLESSAVFPAGVKVIKTDYSGDSLLAAFQGQDTVISAIGGTGFIHQSPMIDAAVKAGVKRFLPSEYSSNTRSPAVRSLVPLFQPKQDILDYLKSKESPSFSWTGLAVGALLDWGLNAGFLGFDFKNRTTTIWDDGNTAFSVTNLDTFGKAVASILKKPEETANMYLYIASVTTTQNKILAAIEDATKTKWITKHMTTEEKIQAAENLISGGDFAGWLIKVQACAWGKIPGAGGNFEQDEVLANEMLGLPEETLAGTVQRVVKDDSFSGAKLVK